MKLNPHHLKAIELMVLGGTNVSVSEAISVSHETVSRWKSDYEFRAELNRRLLESQEATQERLRRLADTAVASIEDILTSDIAQPRDKLLAAFKVLEMVRVTAPDIGPTNPRELQRDDEMMKALDEYGI